MAEKNSEHYLKQLPSKLTSNGKRLTLVKSSNNKYFCFYPESDKKIKVCKGENTFVVFYKMYIQLLKLGIIQKEKPKKEKYKKEYKPVKKPLSKTQLRKRKLTLQNNILKNK